MTRRGLVADTAILENIYLLPGFQPKCHLASMGAEGVEPTRARRREIYSLPDLRSRIRTPKINHISSLPTAVGDITEPSSQYRYRPSSALG